MNKTYVLFLLFSGSFLCVRGRSFKNERRTPVVLVPGDGGSQFYAKLNKSEIPHHFCSKTTDDYFNLWLNLEELAPYAIQCFVDNMKLIYNRTTHKTHNNAGVDIQIRGWGDTETVEWLDPSQYSVTSYFYPIVEAMTKWGYKRGLSVRGAPFDFRKAPNELGDVYKKLKLLVEDTYQKNNNSRVALLAHSMGNPVTLYFLNHVTQAWKDKYIQSFISLAGVWGGVIKTLRLFTSGDNLNIEIVWPLTVRPEQRSMPSTAWLMPSDLFWKKDEVLVMRPGRNYTVNDFKQFFTDIGFMDGYYMQQDTKDLIRELTPPGVTVHCLHGFNLKTPEVLKYTEKTWPNSQPEVIYGNGDGTVNMRSLLGCLPWKQKQKQPVYHKQFLDAEHMQILTNRDIMEYIKSVITS